MHNLCHDNIVELRAVVFETGHYGLVMEYVFLGSLDDFTFKYAVRCSVSTNIARVRVCVCVCVCVFVFRSHWVKVVADRQCI